MNITCTLTFQSQPILIIWKSTIEYELNWFCSYTRRRCLTLTCSINAGIHDLETTIYRYGLITLIPTLQATKNKGIWLLTNTKAYQKIPSLSWQPQIRSIWQKGMGKIKRINQQLNKLRKNHLTCLTWINLILRLIWVWLN